MSGGLCEPSRGLVCGREWVAGSSSWCSTFPGCQPLGITGRYGVKGVAREGRALARPHHRAGARRSQDASHSALPGGTVSREWPGRDEHWLVRIIELVLDVPRKLDTLGGLDARHYRGVRCQGSDPGRTSTSSSTPQYPSTDSAGKAELVALDASLDHRAGFRSEERRVGKGLR